MEDKREDKNLNEAEGRVVEAEKKKLALKAVNPMIFLVVIIALCAIASYIVPAGTYDRVLDAASGREIVDPASFHYIARTPVTLFGLLMSVTQGLQNAAYVIFFLMIIGGTFAVLDATGAMNAGMANVVKATRASDDSYLYDRLWLWFRLLRKFRRVPGLCSAGPGMLSYYGL